MVNVVKIVNGKNCNNGNIQFYNKEESKSNSTISVNSGAHILTHDQIIKKVHSIRIMYHLLKQIKF